MLALESFPFSSLELNQTIFLKNNLSLSIVFGLCWATSFHDNFKKNVFEWCTPLGGQTTLFIIIINLGTIAIKQKPSKSDSADSHGEMNALIKWHSSITALVLDANISSKRSTN